MNLAKDFCEQQFLAENLKIEKVARLKAAKVPTNLPSQRKLKKMAKMGKDKKGGCGEGQGQGQEREQQE